MSIVSLNTKISAAIFNSEASTDAEISSLFSQEKRTGTWVVIFVTLSFWGMVAVTFGVTT